jgi:hypothetical protein
MVRPFRDGGALGRLAGGLSLLGGAAAEVLHDFFARVFCGTRTKILVFSVTSGHDVR